SPPLRGHRRREIQALALQLEPGPSAISPDVVGYPVRIDPDIQAASGLRLVPGDKPGCCERFCPQVPRTSLRRGPAANRWSSTGGPLPGSACGDPSCDEPC